MSGVHPRSDAFRIATRLASEYPTNLFPCPGCAAAVKGENLAGHLRKVHPEADSRPVEPIVRGSDRMMQVWMFPLPWLVVAGFFAAAAMQSIEVDVRLTMGVFIAAFVLASMPLAIAWCGGFPASIEVGTGAMTFRHFLGLGRRTVNFDLRIQTGKIVEERVDPKFGDGGDYPGSVYVLRVGSYLRFIDADGRAFTAGAKRSTHSLRFWEVEHAHAKRRRFWNIQLDNEELVRLQYLLAERGVLVPRSEPA